VSTDATRPREAEARSEELVLELAGDLDMAAAPGFEVRLRDGLGREPHRLLIDLSGVTFVDSTGIRLLLRANERCRELGVELAVTRPSDGVWRVLERFRLETRLPFVAVDAVPVTEPVPTAPAVAGGGARDLRLELPADPHAPALARQAAAEATADLPEEVRDAALLLVSEVVTNAVRHGCTSPDDRVRMTVGREGRSIRFEVEDPGPGVPVRRPGNTERLVRESGWGLVMLERLASRWGIERDPSRVWFELSS